MIKIVDGIDGNGKSKKFRLEIPMKYIRTKDGRIIDNSRCLDQEPLNGLLRFAKEHRKGGKQITIAVKNIVSQADTIEELCDEFVYIPSRGRKIVEAYFSRNNGIEIINVYGAIWTDEGLIYVAKMNEKGELELI